MRPHVEMSSQQRDLRELLADWRSDFPGLAVRIDVTRGDPTLLLIEASANAAVVVTGHLRTAGLPSSIVSVQTEIVAEVIGVTDDRNLSRSR